VKPWVRFLVMGAGRIGLSLLACSLLVVRAGYTVVRIPASLVERDLGAPTALVQRALR
jgi:hypothetical protein